MKLSTYERSELRVPGQGLFKGGNSFYMDCQCVGAVLGKGKQSRGFLLRKGQSKAKPWKGTQSKDASKINFSTYEPMKLALYFCVIFKQ